MNSAPLISVIMPMFNAKQFLDRSVGSIERQTFSDWELIVVDDGSSDGGSEWFAGRPADSRIRVIRQRNSGVSAARNRGIETASGCYLAFLDADDEWHPEFMESMLGAMRDGVVLTYCGWENRGLAGPQGAPFIPPDYEMEDKPMKLFAACPWPIHAALSRREHVVEAGGFDTRLSHAEDYALWLEIAVSGRIVRVPRVLATYNFHGCAQASSDRGRRALQFFEAQCRYLENHREFARALGPRRVREATYGTLRAHAFECYWQRDIEAARKLFRRLLRFRYFKLADIMYMVPSLLPLSVHRKMISVFSRASS